MRIVEASNRRTVQQLVDRRQHSDPSLERRVARIVAGVRRSGDTALLRYARQFDGLSGPIEVPETELEEALQTVSPTLRSALRTSAHIFGG